jgi:hypothetical protein
MDTRNGRQLPRLRPLYRSAPLRRGEFGIRSDLHGRDINSLINRITGLLYYRNFPRVTLKARSKGIEKLCSIIDIIRQRLRGVFITQRNYSNRYVYLNNPNKEVKLPCMDAVISFYRPNPSRFGFNRRRRGGFRRGNRTRGRRQGRGRRGFRPGFRGRRNNNNRGGFRGRGSNNRGSGRGRGNFRGNNNRGGRGNSRGLVARGGNEQQQNN